MSAPLGDITIAQALENAELWRRLCLELQAELASRRRPHCKHRNPGDAVGGYRWEQ